MRKYNVTVNGTAYEVLVEEVSGNAAVPSAPPVAVPVPVAAPAVPAPAAPGAGEPLNSPMPGTILKVNVAVGQAVKSGEVLMILEAMKMENEIMAPKDGVVASVAVASGASVESGTLLCTIA